MIWRQRRHLLILVRKARRQLDEVTRELIFADDVDHAEADNELAEAKARVDALQARVQAIVEGGGQ